MTQADKLLKEILDNWNRSGWGYNPTTKERVEKYLEYESNLVEAPVKPANDDFAIIACMYGILQTQEAAIWNKISGKTKEANEMADKLIPQIEKVTQMIENRLSV